MIDNLKIEILKPDNFLPFGDIINKISSSKELSINQGTTIRHHNISELKLTDQNGTPAISIFSGSPRKIPIEIKIMEKHPIATQSFLPVQNHDWLVVVSKEKNELPDLDTLRCFHVDGNVGITYKANVWHHPLLVKKNKIFGLLTEFKIKKYLQLILKNIILNRMKLNT